MAVPLALVVAIAGVLSVVGLSTASASARNWYVSTAGDDYNSGDISRPLATVSAALGRATTGDTIYLRGGSYHQQFTI